MEKYTGSKRAIALLCALVLVFSTALTGCSVKKITKKTPTGSDDSIKIGDGFDEDESTTIVVGDDGKSYVVDEEGNSVVYNPTSTAVVQGNGGGTVITQPRTNATTQKTTSSSVATTKSTTTTTAKSDESFKNSEVYNALAYQRKFGFNKAYDELARYANFYLDTIRAYFEYNNKLWLVEFWKGEYAMASVGCEIGFYCVNADDTSVLNLGKTYREVFEDEEKGPEYIAYKSVSDADAMNCSMQLWQYVKSTDEKPVKRINFKTTKKCWWAADFQNAVLEKHSDRTTLVMVGTIQFPNSDMRDCFTDQLDFKGFKKVSAGSITSYDKFEVYSVNGNEVTVGWRYYSDGAQETKG